MYKWLNLIDSYRTLKSLKPKVTESHAVQKIWFHEPCELLPYLYINFPGILFNLHPIVRRSVTTDGLCCDESYQCSCSRRLRFSARCRLTTHVEILWHHNCVHVSGNTGFILCNTNVPLFKRHLNRHQSLIDLKSIYHCWQVVPAKI